MPGELETPNFALDMGGESHLELEDSIVQVLSFLFEPFIADTRFTFPEPADLIDQGLFFPFEPFLEVAPATI